VAEDIFSFEWKPLMRQWRGIVANPTLLFLKL